MLGGRWVLGFHWFWVGENGRFVDVHAFAVVCCCGRVGTGWFCVEKTDRALVWNRWFVVCCGRVGKGWLCVVKRGRALDCDAWFVVCCCCCGRVGKGWFCVVKTDRELDVQILLPLLDPVCEVNPGIGGLLNEKAYLYCENQEHWHFWWKHQVKIDSFLQKKLTESSLGAVLLILTDHRFPRHVW